MELVKNKAYKYRKHDNENWVVYLDSDTIVRYIGPSWDESDETITVEGASCTHGEPVFQLVHKDSLIELDN